VLPLELESAAQRFYEAYGGLGRGFDRRVVDGSWFREFRTAVADVERSAPPPNAAFRATIFADPRHRADGRSAGPGMPSGVGGGHLSASTRS
jgi:hypothetical protein